MPRAFLLVMDSLGIGGAPDAGRFGDEGTDTLGHIAAACAAGRADRDGLRAGALDIPNLTRLGLAAAAELSSGQALAGITGAPGRAAWGVAREQSLGKDTPSGHWEMAGLPVTFDWGYFPKAEPCFPGELTETLITQAALPGLLGNRHASGTQIIEELGDLHLESGRPIIYTSADSVFQIAAHEEAFGLDHLYEVCAIARRLVDAYDVGRVIARPFLGQAGDYVRTGNRRDYATPPHEPTLLDRINDGGGEVIAIGKISDIFAGRGISRSVKAHGNEALMAATVAVAVGGGGDLVFTNFVDFDSLYGHRRDIAGYAAAIEAFDAALPELEAALRPDDLVLISADHGCDPTWPGSDHTREQVPVLAFGPGLAGGPIGIRESFADIGQTIAGHLGLDPLPNGVPFL
ncbi:MAG TPA: phosphopentomutase [Alphaproteobacteria bacterium]|jgi:phosphopentomutase|nr:phosphopentomutase [Alphaproteobacteria bacterium]